MKIEYQNYPPVFNSQKVEQTKPDLRAMEQKPQAGREDIIDKIDVKLPTSSSSNIIKDLYLNNGSKALLVYSKDTNSIAAFVTREGTTMEVKQENLPKEFKSLNTEAKFNGFLQNAYGKISGLNGGDTKLEIEQRLFGGGSSHSSSRSSSQSQPPFQPRPRATSLVCQRLENQKEFLILRGDELEFVTGPSQSSGSYSIAKHTAIYIGNDEVVELVNNNQKAEIERCTLGQDAKLSNNNKKSKDTKFSNEIIVERAIARVGSLNYTGSESTANYDLLDNNCQMFTAFCQTGKQTSYQADPIKKTGTVIGVTLTTTLGIVGGIGTTGAVVVAINNPRVMGFISSITKNVGKHVVEQAVGQAAVMMSQMYQPEESKESE